MVSPLKMQNVTSPKGLHFTHNAVTLSVISNSLPRWGMNSLIEKPDFFNDLLHCAV